MKPQPGLRSFKEYNVHKDDKSDILGRLRYQDLHRPILPYNSLSRPFGGFLNVVSWTPRPRPSVIDAVSRHTVHFL